ncbi:MAG: CoA ester lyase [Alphaproteobacteria bacterium]|nr:CoA ester lyase [Alphaproteobacteria bacterium]
MTPGWRSLLFVPAAAQKLWARAHTRGADCIIVDLEDSTQPEAKSAARALASEAVRAIAQQGADVVVRVNNDPEHLEADLMAAATPGLRAIVFPKTASAAEIQALDARLKAIEDERALASGSIGVVAVIEDPLALERIASIAEAPRLIGLCLGSEDFALALGRAPSPASLDLACQQVAYAAAARGLMGLGMACGIGNFTDLDRWNAEARRAYAMGLTGALAIHPNQIAGLNAAFGASEAEIEDARAILAAWDQRTSGVVSHLGRMIDQPVVERARRIVRTLRP